MLVQEEVPLHGLEPGQLLHAHRRPLVADPHTEATLKHHPAQLAEVPLGVTRRKVSPLTPPTGLGAAAMLLCGCSAGRDLISCDGDLVHRVVDRLEQLQHRVQRLLEFTAVLLLSAVFQQLLSTHTHTQTHTGKSISPLLAAPDLI